MKLLEPDSKTVLRRLVREINGRLRAGESVYAQSLKDGKRGKVLAVSLKSPCIWAETTIGRIPAGLFFTGHGAEICASREA